MGTEAGFPPVNALCIKSSVIANGPNIIKAGTPVLVILDPSSITNNKVKIDYEDKDSVKLWVLNRIDIYVSEDGRNWRHYWGSFEGCLSELTIRLHPKWGKYRFHHTLKKGIKRFVHFTTMPPSAAIHNKRLSKLSIKPPPVEGPNEKIKRPYPEGFRPIEEWEYFNNGIFSRGILVLSISAKDVKYPSSISSLTYWQLKIFNLTQDANVIKFQRQLKAGALNNTEEDELKNLLRQKRGSWLAQIYRHSKGNTEVKTWHPSGYLKEEDEHCFIHGIHSDEMQSADTEEGQIIANSFFLWNMSRPHPKDKNVKPTYTAPINSIFKKFSFDRFFRHYFALYGYGLGYPDMYNDFETQRNSVQTFRKIRAMNENDLAEDLLKKVDQALKSITDNYSAKILKGGFQIGIGDDRVKATMMALGGVALREESFIKQESLDLMKSKSRDKEYWYSLLRVFFARGSDSFSEDITPEHVFIQLKNWWNNLSSDKQERIKDSTEIEVIGFSSRLTTETTQDDNKRLRRDRAWKTAVSLMHLFQLEGIKATVEEMPNPSEMSIYEIEDESSGGRGGEIAIYYRPAPIDLYPERKQFSAHEFSCVYNLMDEENLELREIRDITNDDPEDRICFVVFKRPAPEYSQITKELKVTTTALPIYKYKTVLHIEKNYPENDVVLLYVCPGILADK